MNLHEYQAKQLFRDYGIAVSDGIAASSAKEAEKAALSLGVSKWVVKAQVHAGGRGKAGGGKILDNLEDLEKLAKELLGKKLVTHQTGPEGKEVKRLMLKNLLILRGSFIYLV